jgi:hypothetical protein
VWRAILSGKTRNPYSVWVRKIWVKRPFGGARRRWEYTEMELKKDRRSGLDSPY